MNVQISYLSLLEDRKKKTKKQKKLRVNLRPSRRLDSLRSSRDAYHHYEVRSARRTIEAGR